MSNDGTDKSVTRRKAIKKIGAGGIALTGGMGAISGTATADHQNRIPGHVTVLSSRNDWEYRLRVTSTHPKPSIKKRAYADNADNIVRNGYWLNGNINRGGKDTYGFPDVINFISVTTDGWDSFAIVDGVSSDLGNLMRIRGYGNRYDYEFRYQGSGAYSLRKGGLAEENEDNINGNYASGFVNASGADTYYVGGYLQYMMIGDPDSSSEAGFKVRFNPG